MNCYICHDLGEYVFIINSFINDYQHIPMRGLYLASLKGSIVLVQHMMGFGGADLDLVLRTACQIGHIHLAKWIIKRTHKFKYKNFKLNFNLGLYEACSNGHRDLVNLMIEKGADDFNRGLYGACCGGYRDLVDLMIEKGACELESRSERSLTCRKSMEVS